MPSIKSALEDFLLAACSASPLPAPTTSPVLDGLHVHQTPEYKDSKRLDSCTIHSVAYPIALSFFLFALFVVMIYMEENKSKKKLQAFKASCDQGESAELTLYGVTLRSNDVAKDIEEKAENKVYEAVEVDLADVEKIGTTKAMEV